LRCTPKRKIIGFNDLVIEVVVLNSVGGCAGGVQHGPSELFEDAKPWGPQRRIMNQILQHQSHTTPCWEQDYRHPRPFEANFACSLFFYALKHDIAEQPS